MSDVLLLPQMMNLDMYLEMRVITVCDLVFAWLYVLTASLLGVRKPLGRRHQAVLVAFSSYCLDQRCRHRSVHDECHKSLEYEQHEDP